MVVVAFFAFSSFIFTHAFSRIVISVRELEKAKKINEMKLKRSLPFPSANC